MVLEMDQTLSNSEQLCMACGLCCNGVIFADVQLQPGDDPKRLHALDLVPKTAIDKFQEGRGKVKIKQPCPAFCGQCRIYADRPKHCADFECALLKSLEKGHNDLASALKIVATAKKRAEKVRKLLRELGETEETLALSKRFRRVAKRMESEPCDEASADAYGQLTLATHDLNYLLSEAFYPGR
jgi:uncharacterized protein